MKGYRARLTEMAEAALEDVRDQLTYDVVDGVKVSKIGEGTRQKYNLALMALHPEAPKQETGARLTFTIESKDAKLVASAMREISLSRVYQDLQELPAIEAHAIDITEQRTDS